MLSREELYIARLMFQVKIFDSDGQAYEKLFSTVMGLSEPGFKQIKPQGKIGDRGNDGYIKDTGTYFQVYAPENLKARVSVSLKKLKVDFEKLRVFWDRIAPIRFFFFVLNDKYKGSFPEMEAALSDLAGQHPGIGFEAFLSSDLEQRFLGLSEDDVVATVGFIPSPSKIESVDYRPLTQVLSHLNENALPYSAEDTYLDHDFMEKIRFNGLGARTTGLLTTADFQANVIDDFFKMNSEFAKQSISEYLHKLYLGMVQAKPENENSDWIFFRILSQVSDNNKSKPLQDAALVVMAYFFASCDIFEEPPP